MLQVNEIRENKEKYVKALAKRGLKWNLYWMGFYPQMRNDEVRKHNWMRFWPEQ